MYCFLWHLLPEAIALLCLQNGPTLNVFLPFILPLNWLREGRAHIYASPNDFAALTKSKFNMYRPEQNRVAGILYLWEAPRSGGGPFTPNLQRFSSLTLAMSHHSPYPTWSWFLISDSPFQNAYQILFILSTPALQIWGNFTRMSLARRNAISNSA